MCRYDKVLDLTMRSEGQWIVAIAWGRRHEGEDGQSALLEEAQRQLREYFQGRRRTFSLPLRMEGTPFQKAVWTALLLIPWGEKRSYSEVAAMVGKPTAIRAVASACSRNPLAIVVPCHRVVRKGGELGGYAGGADRKRMLLALEREGREDG